MQPSVGCRGNLLISLLAVTLTACTSSQTLVVSPTGANSVENCVNLQANLAGITDNAPNNRYLIRLKPGIYDCGATEIVMKEHVDIEGAGRGLSEIRGTGASPVDVVQMASHSELRNLTVTNAATPGGAVTIAIHAPDVTDARITEVDARVLSANGDHAQAIRFVGSGQIEATYALVEGRAQTNCGVAVQGHPTLGGTARLSNVITEAYGGIRNTAFCEETPSQQAMEVEILDSVLNGGTASVRDPGGHVRIAHSMLIGPATGTAGPRCFDTYDGDYARLGANCR